MIDYKSLNLTLFYRSCKLDPTCFSNSEPDGEAVLAVAILEGRPPHRPV